MAEPTLAGRLSSVFLFRNLDGRRSKPIDRNLRPTMRDQSIHERVVCEVSSGANLVHPGA